MSVPTRFPNGITNVTKGSPLGDYIALDPSRAHQYFDDFDYYNPDDWTVIGVGSSSQTLIDGDGGILEIANSAGPTDLSLLSKKGASFFSGLDRNVFFKWRFSVTEPVTSGYFGGIQSIVDGKGFIFASIGGENTLQFMQTDGATQDWTVLDADLSTEPITLGCVFDSTGPEDVFRVYQDDNLLKTIPAIPGLDGVPKDLAMLVSNDGTPAAKLRVDYILAAQT